PFVVAPVFAMGCAQADDSGDQTESAASAGASISFTAAVGVVEVGGERICTAALVDVDAGAHVGPVSARGRQRVLAGACLGRLSNGFLGGAVFVTHVGHETISTPIIAIDFSDRESAGVAVGILSDAPRNVTPLKPFVGFSAGAHAGIHGATLLRT